MAWTNPPRTWVTNEFVTAALLNTHLRDQLIFLKSDPIIAETTVASNVSTDGVVATLSGTSIPADVGEVHCEFWSTGFGFTNSVANPSSAFLVLSETTAGEIGRAQFSFSNVGTSAHGPLRLRTRDFAWAGTSRTVTATLTGSNCTGLLVASAASPIVLRIVRAY